MNEGVNRRKKGQKRRHGERAKLPKGRERKRIGESMVRKQRNRW
jgi:hypothetical protein